MAPVGGGGGGGSGGGGNIKVVVRVRPFNNRGEYSVGGNTLMSREQLRGLHKARGTTSGCIC